MAVLLSLSAVRREMPRPANGYKGAILENLIADIFSKMGRKLYYYHKDSGLEIDFVTRYKGACTLIEVKATNGNVKA
jgi:predicted AAA+ superfamily ATPase